MIIAVVGLALLFLLPLDGWGQEARARALVPADTLHLEALHTTARRLDPRHRQLALQQAITQLRLRNLGVEWYPSLTLSAQATYQTEVTSIENIGGPGGAPSFSVPEPSKDQYEVAAEVNQLIYDGNQNSLGRQVERARLAEQEAGVRASLFGLRAAVSNAFFAAVLAQERRAQLGVLASDLRARLDLVSAQSRRGAALPADTATIAAELIRVRQDLAQAEADRRAALAVLEALVGTSVHPGDVLAMPALEDRAGAALTHLVAQGALAFEEKAPPSPEADGVEAALLDSLVRRPEIEQFNHTRRRLRAEAAVAETSARPRVSLFARGVYGKPGLNFFDDTFGPHALVGVRARWSILDWGRSDRQAEALRVQAEVVATERDAFVERVRRETFTSLYDIERFREALAEDEKAVALREAVERTARRQLEEGVLLVSEYVDRRSDVFDARFRQTIHRVRLAEAQARLLRTLGMELDGGGPGRGRGLRERIAPPETTLSHPPPSPDGDS